MIKERYQITDILKETQQKSILKVQENSNQAKKQFYIVKKFNSKQKKYFDNELYLYNVVLKDAYLKGFSEIKDVIQEKNGLYLVFNELGQNLDYLRKRTGGRLTLKTVLMVALQMLERIELLHEKGYVHGDIQPTNFVIGTGKLKHKIYLVDLQFCFPYTVNEKHISEEHVENFSGSIRFCSIPANQHKNISRRDDLESFVYSMIYLLKGYLPWFELKSDTLIQAYNETAKLKKEKLDELLQGLPQNFSSILNYTKSLKFNQKPNYDKIRGQLSSLMKKNGYQIDYKYDWIYV